MGILDDLIKIDENGIVNKGEITNNTPLAD